MAAKTVLCFGDSNTWAYIPGTEARRFAPDVRWTGVLAAQLGDAYRVVEEGLNSRTTVWDDPCTADRNGSKHLPMLLDTHAPIDLIIIMLGTNDLKHYFGLSANDIALGASTLVQMVQQSSAGPVADGPGSERQADAAPQVLLVSPVPMVKTPNPFGHKFDDAVAKSQGLASAYKEITESLGCHYFDAGTVTTCPDTDGVHIDDAGHAALGAALAQQVKRIC